MEREESFVTQAHLAAINLAASCLNLETVTHVRDTSKLNIRRLFKELFQPGLQDDTFVCLDSLLRGIVCKFTLQYYVMLLCIPASPLFTFNDPSRC